MSKTNYNALCESLKALTDGVPYETANLSNASALLFSELEDLNWAGFYLTQGEKLVLGPFQGRPACIEIPFGKGVCGNAAKEGKTLVVQNVHLFPGHIACDAASNAEIVVPVRKNGLTVGVLDIDSPLVGRFSEEDRIGLEQFVSVLEENVFK